MLAKAAKSLFLVGLILWEEKTDYKYVKNIQYFQVEAITLQKVEQGRGIEGNPV